MSEYDVFISYASEAREVVAPLAHQLAEVGLRVWFDEFELSWGDSLREAIDHGLSTSKHGIVVISPEFFQKQWTKYEFNGLMARQIDGEKVLLPLLYRVNHADLLKSSPSLADLLTLEITSQNLGEIVEAVRTMIARRADPRSAWRRYYAVGTVHRVDTRRTANRGARGLLRLRMGVLGKVHDTSTGNDSLFRVVAMDEENRTVYLHRVPEENDPWLYAEQKYHGRTLRVVVSRITREFAVVFLEPGLTGLIPDRVFVVDGEFGLPQRKEAIVGKAIDAIADKFDAARKRVYMTCLPPRFEPWYIAAKAELRRGQTVRARRRTVDASGLSVVTVEDRINCRAKFLGDYDLPTMPEVEAEGLWCVRDFLDDSKAVLLALRPAGYYEGTVAEAREALPILFPLGLDVGSAAKIARIASKYPCEIYISAQERSAEANSILSLIGLNAVSGTLLEVSAFGVGAQDAVTEIAAYILGGDP